MSLESQKELKELKRGSLDLLVIAGEHSGDEHAAALVRDILEAQPNCRIAAIGGPALKATQACFLYPLVDHAVVGFFEVFKHYGFFKKFFNALLDWIERTRPRAICLVDYPGFNLRLAQALKEKKLSTQGGGFLKVLYYIAPQIWAWKAQRRFAMAGTLDSLATIFPFEADLFKDTALPVNFVGHPLVQGGPVASAVTYDPQAPLLLCPGSRDALLRRHLPLFFKTVTQLRAISLRPLPVTLRLAQNTDLQKVLAKTPLPPDCQVVTQGPVSASAVLTSAGTISLQCALAGVPGVLAYKTHPLTYALGKHWIRVPYLGMANLLLPEPVYPEYIQSAATPQALSAELTRLDPKKAQKAALALKTLLNAPAAGSASGWVLDALNA